MGFGLLHQTLFTKGFVVSAAFDVNPAKVALAKKLAEHHAALRPAQLCGSFEEFLTFASKVDVMIDASSAIADSRTACLHFIDRGRHVFMMNAESDLEFGPEFLRLAEARGAIYSSIDGDQHGVIKGLTDEVSGWGFKLVMLGNIKGFLDRYATPISIAPEARKRDLDPRMCCAFTDGSKLSIEMALLANAFGAVCLQPGMRGPRIGHVEQVLSHFALDQLWDGTTPIVDYILGAQPDGGVFVVGYSDDSYHRKMMRYYKRGDGPFYVFYRPYHLCHVESLATIERSLLHKEGLLQPVRGRRAGVICYAKRDLAAGTVLDGLGGADCYGQIENEPVKVAGVPICLADGSALGRAVRRDERIALADVLPGPLLRAGK
jgi:predicted homoserine dehydrogenase-like protein